MPTYEYQCRSCAHRYEAFQSITAPTLTRCPHCGKKCGLEAAKKDKDQEGSGRAPLPLAGSAPPKDGTGQKMEA